MVGKEPRNYTFIFEVSRREIVSVSLSLSRKTSNPFLKLRPWNVHGAQLRVYIFLRLILLLIGSHDLSLERQTLLAGEDAIAGRFVTT